MYSSFIHQRVLICIISCTQKSESSKKKLASTPKTPNNSKTTNTTPASSAKRIDFQNRLSKFSTFDTPASSPKANGTGSGDKWPHLLLPWLQPNRIQDNKRRSPDHPDYDPKTLYVPRDFLDNCTPVIVNHTPEIIS